MSVSYIRYSILKVVLCLFSLGIVPNLYAQTTYKVTYHISEPKLLGSKKDLDKKGKQLVEQIVDYAKNINYILITNQNESYFEQENILKKESNNPLEPVLEKMAKRFASFHKAVYANHNEDSIIFIKNLLDQDFKVKRNYYNFNWVLKDDNKKIMGFNAKKALGSYINSVTNKELKVEAWFIPSIPLQSGPDIFMGLPGLIAEINLNKAVITIKKIEKNTNLEINKVDDSKVMTQKEYEVLIKDLTKKFID